MSDRTAIQIVTVIVTALVFTSGAVVGDLRARAEYRQCRRLLRTADDTTMVRVVLPRCDVWLRPTKEAP